MTIRTIGEAAKAAGVTARAVRLYESKGLLATPNRTTSGYRLFTDDDVEALKFIRQGRSLGLSLDAIADVITLSTSGVPCCERTRALLAQRVTEIDAAIVDLQRLRDTIARALLTDADPSAGRRCVIIERSTDSD